MKKLIILLFSVFIFANDNAEVIKNIIGENKFKTYYPLLEPIINKKTSLKNIINYLQNNGLLEIFFDSPRNIHPTFIFKNNNPILETKILYESLTLLGYYYYYPIKIINREDYYKITLEIQSTHYINPILLIETLSNQGCEITNLIKKKNYTYTIDCKDAYLNAPKIKNKTIYLRNSKSIYWINTNNFKKIYIQSAKYDKWYPYIIIYDKNLNILDAINLNTIRKKIFLTLPFRSKYIKITDNFSPENIKRGIKIKGIE